MKNSILHFITVISIFSFNCFAQKTVTLLTAEKPIKYVYVDVIKTYERVGEKGYKSIDMFEKIGNTYHANSEYDKAAKWYCELFAITTDLKSECYYRYAHSLKAIGQNDKANEILELFAQKNRQNNTTNIPLKNNHHEK